MPSDEAAEELPGEDADMLPREAGPRQHSRASQHHSGGGLANGASGGVDVSAGRVRAPPGSLELDRAPCPPPTPGAWPC